MFNDFHESTRNVGAMSMILGILVVVGFGGLASAVFSAESRNAPTQSLESKLEGLATRQAGVQLEIHEQAKDLKKLEGFQAIKNQLENKSTQLAQFEKQLAQVRAEYEKLNDERAAIQKEFESYRASYRNNERLRAEGEIIDLSATKGERFKNVKILSISPLHLRVMLSSGPVGIPYTELPLAVQDRFQFGLEEVTDYKDRLAYQDMQSKRREAYIQKKRERKKAANAIVNRTHRIEELQTLIVQLKAKVRAYEAKGNDAADEARKYEQQAAMARETRRITMAPSLARKARARANRAFDKANQYSATINRSQAELDRLIIENNK